ncbi:hypothetical protein Pcinc_009977 [Petrolisthes cinctipes]|uniref:Uncharacterized protein n=1 Tax=Petrolisthes cinctipes TaxID=88211 RepID=A0AAE1KXW6_PETCI|nr:hypothetical protein Pcinc_009977 [Petrolisthes cinctipes]
MHLPPTLLPLLLVWWLLLQVVVIDAAAVGIQKVVSAAAVGVEMARLQYVASLEVLLDGLVKEVESLGVVMSPGTINTLLLSHLPPRLIVSMCVPDLIPCVSGRLVPLHTEPTTLALLTLPVNGSCRRYHLSYKEEVNCVCEGAAIHTSAMPLYHTLPHLDLAWTITPNVSSSSSPDSKCQAGVTVVRETPDAWHQHEVSLPLSSDGRGDSLKVWLCTNNICPGGYNTLIDVHYITHCLTLASGVRVRLEVPQHKCGCDSSSATITNTTTLATTLSSLTLIVTHCGDAFFASPFNLTSVLAHLLPGCGCDELTQSHTAFTQPTTFMPSIPGLLSLPPTRTQTRLPSQAILTPTQTKPSLTHTQLTSIFTLLSPTPPPPTTTTTIPTIQTHLHPTLPPYQTEVKVQTDVNEVMAMFESPAASTASHIKSLLKLSPVPGVILMMVTMLW